MSTPVSASIADPAPFNSSAFRNGAEVAGRVLLATLFLLSGLGKIGSYSATAAYMSAAGVASALLPLVIAIEVGGAISIIVGWKTRVTAFLLAGFSLATALAFHSNFADQVQTVMFLKNVSIAGGFLLLVANGAGPFSLDRRLARQEMHMSSPTGNQLFQPFRSKALEQETRPVAVHARCVKRHCPTEHPLEN